MTDALEAERVIIVVRQTPDWAAFAAGNATHDPDAFDALTGRPEGFTSQLIRVWDEAFPKTHSFFRTRARMKEIATANWLQANGVHLMSIERFTPPFDNAALYVFTDDDDWFAPELGLTLLQSEARGANAAVWRSARFDGTLLLREADGFCFTNNYAVHGTFLTAAGEDWPLSRQHMEAQELVHRPETRLKVVDQVLSVTNKHPCSFTTLERLAKGSQPVRSVVARYHDYLRQTRESLPERVKWAVACMDETAAWFSRIAVSPGQRPA